MLAHDLVRTFGDRRVLDGVSLTAAPGQRIGLIGENGVGKSTLLKVLSGADEPDAGSVERPADVGFLPQEIAFDDETTFADILDDALKEARGVLAELDRLAEELGRTPDDPEVLDAYSALLDHAQRHEVWDADRRAEIVLAGLGLADAPRHRRLATLSGGQRSRLMLAALVVRRPSALLLDEPTNHLDDDAAAFLASHLSTTPGVVIVSSHDRAFLDAVCTDLIDLDPAVDGPTRYGGNYTAYLAQKRADHARWQRRFEEEQEQLAALRVSAAVTAHEVAPNNIKNDNEKMGYGHSGGRVQNQISRRVRNATRRLDTLEREQLDEPPQPLRLRPGAFAADLRDEPLITLREVEVRGRVSMECLDIEPAERLLLTGTNGAGKSTLLGVLAGTQPHTGTSVRRPGLTVGLLSQDTAFDRDDLTAREIYDHALGPELAEHVPLQSLGLLSAWDQDRAVGVLSVGQRRRLALALLMAQPPELLLLDEPTNHLSPRLCDELEEAMGPGPGAIVVASHDRWLRSRWQGREIRLRSA